MSDNKLKVNLQMGILKPLHEVFEAIVDPEKMINGCFTGKNNSCM